jgi:hypothetical protein
MCSTTLRLRVGRRWHSSACIMPRGATRKQKRWELVYAWIVSTDLNDLRLLAGFGEACPLAVSGVY